MSPQDSILIAGATLRLTRLITTDSIGRWWIVDPIKRLTWKKADPTVEFDEYGEIEGGVNLDDVKIHQVQKYLDGFKCPFCAGYWAGVLVTGSYWAARAAGPRALAAWRFGAGTFALNYLTGHISAKLD